MVGRADAVMVIQNGGLLNVFMQVSSEQLGQSAS